ncbi:hypothetical protein [Gryllotalpicola ginsengisoli]|uniref:hypothetical protein n=1 Tax=Gryllotalpicola ginsengisoli TaxID=444608 RepID=UPI0003B4E71A|nr:hypothetical protein [Gryllotalpicola ginsengisoli]
MRRWRTDEAGNASLEFLTAGVLLLVPLVYLALALATIQGATLGVEGAAREAARAYVQAATDASGRSSADESVTVALADHRIDRAPGDLELHCDTGDADCLAAGHRITATVRVSVALPLVPVARVPVEATASAPIFRLGAAP